MYEHESRKIYNLGVNSEFAVGGNVINTFIQPPSEKIEYDFDTGMSHEKLLEDLVLDAGVLNWYNIEVEEPNIQEK